MPYQHGLFLLSARIGTPPLNTEAVSQMLLLTHTHKCCPFHCVTVRMVSRLDARICTIFFFFFCSLSFEFFLFFFIVILKPTKPQLSDMLIKSPNMENAINVNSGVSKNDIVYCKSRIYLA